MKKSILICCLLLFVTFIFAQPKQSRPSVKLTGKVIDKTSSKPLDYVTISVLNNTKVVTGGITNDKGEFDIDVPVGTYTIKFEYSSFKTYEIKQKQITADINLGTISLIEDPTQLQAVEVRSEKTTVEMKLDKKVYNLGKDLVVKGGTVSDVLNNIPSVTVDQDGTIALRGNENLRILIDGKPSNAINISDVLKQIPADAIDKVEVVTNPSARYDAEGGAGLLNIILKKGKNQGINGSIIVGVGDPRNNTISGAVNFKSKNFNLFTNSGYSNRSNPGNAINDSRYKNSDGSTRNYIYEQRYNDNQREGYNINFGIELFLDKTTSWTHAINYRKNDGINPETVTYTNSDANAVFQSQNIHQNDQTSSSESVEYTTNFIKKFKRDGHKLSIDGAFSKNNDDDLTKITDVINERTSNDQQQTRNIIQADYVLPFGKDSQLEAGYKGDFTDLTTDFAVGSISSAGVYTPYPNYTNILNYVEKVNALYTQIGTKYKKFSVLAGLRWEDSKININQLTTQDFNKKRYNNFFPSIFLNYDLGDQTSISLNYSKRINRPRGRQINPFSGYSSNITLFQGNPDLDPAFTDAIELGYMKKWDKFTLSTSAYVNKTKNSFQFVRKESGQFVDIGGVPTPVVLMTPINLATETRYGFEFTLNYNPYKWWKLNTNFNYFQINSRGDFVYTNYNNVTISQNFDNDTSSWFARLNSKINLPYKIDWQTNFTYNGPQDNRQGRVYGIYGLNLGFSKDVLNDKGTVAFNISDVFNSRKRIFDTDLTNVTTHTEFQRQVRQYTLTFTYRFNKKKGEKEKPMRRDNDEEMGG